MTATATPTQRPSRTMQLRLQSVLISIADSLKTERIFCCLLTVSDMKQGAFTFLSVLRSALLIFTTRHLGLFESTDCTKLENPELV